MRASTPAVDHPSQPQKAPLNSYTVPAKAAAKDPNAEHAAQHEGTAAGEHQFDHHRHVEGETDGHEVTDQ